jgi:acyl-CoA synthetase (AMP-forming)/AMP-acid ligase II
MSGTLSTDLRNLPELLAARAAEIGDERFVRDAQQEWTYAEFAARVAEVAAGLREHGVGEGDVVGVVLPNSPHYLEIWWGILWLGAVFNPVNPALTTREAVGILSDSKASCVVATADAAAGLEENREELPALRELVIAGEPDLAAPLRGHGSVEPASFGPDQLASFVYTSGTTGRPKGAMLSHGNLLTNAWQLGEPMPVNRGETMGMVLPLFHVNAQLVTTVMPLFLGAQVAMWERFSASKFWEEVERFEPVTFSSVPTMLAALLHAPGADQAETNTIRFVLCGAAPLSPALFRRFEEKFGLKIMEGYGLTEGTCCSTINPFNGPRKIGSIGLPTRAQEVVIFDEESGEIAGPGVVGEVGVRGANVMAGYYERPDANAETLRDGWLHTGDVGYRDEDGYFFLVDRVKDMIIRGGENIYPREIEDALLENPNVKEAAVVGRPDEVRGEEVHAVVALIEGDDVVVLEEHCRERLAAFKVPSSWEVVAELPKTSTGKIDKKPLRARLADAAPQ